MTREEREDAIKFFEEVAKREVGNAKYSRLAIEALEQESAVPMRVIEDIKTEINRFEIDQKIVNNDNPICSECYENTFDIIRKIIGKHISGKENK